MSAATLDLCVPVICKNSARTIERTIRSVSGLARRVILVDSGSTDGTREIAAGLGAEVMDHAWEGYVRQKQWALEQCDSEWALSLDSDESIDEALAAAVRAAIGRDDPADAGYAANRMVWFHERPLRHVWQPEWRTRLVRTARARWAGYDPHDRLDVQGRVGRLAGSIRHDAFATIAEFVRRQVEHGLLAAESYHAMGRRGSVLRLLASPPAAVLKQVVARSAWRDGWCGWVAAFGTGMHAAAKQMRLLELSRHEGDSR